MCVYSMVAEHFGDKWQKIYPTTPYVPGITYPTPIMPPEEIEKFRKDAKELEELLKKAKEYDERNNEPDCELDEKKKTLQDIADRFGVEINFP